MKHTDRELNTILDDVTAEIRDEKLDAAVVAGAAQRVQTRLAGQQAAAEAGVTPVEHIRSCDDFRSLIPSYLQGQLSSARTMLLEDHTRECLPCRKALKEARHGRQSSWQLESQKAKVTASNRRLKTIRWAVAAAVVAVVGLFAWPSAQRFVNSFRTLNAIVEAANGNVYRVTENSTQALKPGEQIKRGERIRTAKNSAAIVKLADGSLIEMRERSEFSVTNGSDGTTINLDRGQIIVEASKQGIGKQRDGKLFVATDDSLVSVTGTIFTVNNGTKGARVSVIEGEVHVDHAGKNSVLHAGDQVTTHESVEKIAVKDEIAWSRKSAEYVKQLDAVRAEIDQLVAMPGNRYSTRLLDLMPENTVLYVAIPNVSETLAKADQILQENLARNPELNDWYGKQQGRSGGRQGLNQAIQIAKEFGSYLGDEIAIAATGKANGGEPNEPIILAEVKDAGALRSFLESKAAQFGEGKKHLQIVDDPMAINSNIDGLNVWITQDLVVASPRIESLKQVEMQVKAAAKPFAANPFRKHIASLYEDGAGLVIAADLEKMVVQSLRKDKDAAFVSQLGLLDLRYFVVELKEKDGKPYNRAVVSYKQNDHGVTSWLAAPNPMGALEFISPDATVVGSFVVQEPTSVVDDLLNSLKTADPDAWQKVMDFQNEQGISIRNDIAAPLGSEYAFAVDGPVVPVPSFKAIIQVDDQTHLQTTLERTVDKVNVELANHGKQPLVWVRTEIGGRTFYELKSPDAPLVSLNYAYAYGYLIAAPSRALVENAIKYKESGRTLLSSAKFQASLPADKQANFSAMVYQNVSALTDAASKLIRQAGPKEANKAIKTFLGNKAGLAYVYALNDRMILSINSENGPIGLTPSDLLGLPSSSGLGSFFPHAAR
ncbi:MAG: FecR domain-containing protein [Acidobacteriota bacterium]|nr:FecR domain-containing protein [Acidobacteriota bacterium]